MIKTAGIIIIGDEILSGMVEECNALYMARELRMRGVAVKRISVIGDNVDEIATEVRQFSVNYDYVFTSGGIGPTHDDVSIEGISKAFNVEPVIHEYLRNVLLQRYGGTLTPERLKMAEVPNGGDIITDTDLKFPLICYKNIYIFPGVPKYLREKLNILLRRFNGKPVLFKKIYVDEYESEIAPHLNKVVKNHSLVKIGSYPFFDDRNYKVMLTLESIDELELQATINEITFGPFKEYIVKIED